MPPKTGCGNIDVEKRPEDPEHIYQNTQSIDIRVILGNLIDQGFSALALNVQFSFNPHQPHLNKLNNIFRVTRKLQSGKFDQGWR